MRKTMEGEMQRVGYIGLGAMGLPMARNIMKAEFELTVWARRAESAAPLLSEGARWADTPGELATWADVIVLCVTNSPDVRGLVLDAGVLEGARRGTVIVDMSTIAPGVSRELAERCEAKGVYFLDAPVSGGTQGAHAGTLTIMVGGNAAALDAARPVLEALGKRIFHVGPSGSGEIVKLVNNVLVGTIAAATAEAFVLGVKAGADVQVMADVVGASTGASWQLANQFPLRAFPGTFQPGFMTDLLVKDLDLALQLGDDTETPLALAALSRRLYGDAQSQGHGRDDYTSVLRVLELEAGTEVRVH
jgi:3-hydroxyisobutyrate dehydrogenase